MKEIINDLLGYDGLKIIQRPDVFNFSLDSTILAHFVTINVGDKKIIDFGCGNAPIPLFLSLKTKTAHIYGVEIQPLIYDLAVRSVVLNKLENRISIINGDVKDIYKTIGVSTFDVVTCNPPFFKVKNNSNINQSIYKTIARHEVSMNLEDVLCAANRLLKDGGTLAIVHRANRLVDVLEVFRKYHFEPKRLRFVYPKEDSTEALAILIEAKKQGKAGELKILKPLYIYDHEQKWTKEILDIFNYRH